MAKTNTTQSSKPGRGLVLGFLATAIRLSFWWFVITIVFRCPSTSRDLSNASPAICKSYFDLQEQIVPYVKPYYDEYASPYVQSFRPYIDSVYEKAYAPTVAFVEHKYSLYGAPRWEKFMSYSESQWSKTVKPKLDDAQRKASYHYDIKVSPVISQAQEAVDPYLKTANDAAQQQYQNVVLPTYKKSLPYARKLYDQVLDFAKDIVIPYSRLGFQTIYRLVSKNLWPSIRVLYGQNVEPQISKIRERLTSYRDIKKLEAEFDAYTSSERTQESTLQTTQSTTAVHDRAQAAVSEASSVINAEKTASSSVDRPQNITEDLIEWQKKFAKASGKGAEDLRDRVTDITARQVKTGEEVGQALVTSLDGIAKTWIDKFRENVIREISKLPEDPSEEQFSSALAKVPEFARDTGKAIQRRGQDLRAWRVKHDDETRSLVRMATEYTLEVIDSIRDLGLQEIGLRWAKVENVSYRDWEEYHTLKKTFDDWRGEVERAATEHPGLEKAKKVTYDQVELGMKIAEDAAKEIPRLKKVAAWKIEALDDSDDWSERTTPAKIMRLGRKGIDSLSEAAGALTGTPDEPASSLTSAIVESAKEALSTASASVLAPAASSASSFYSEAGEATDSAANAASSILKDLGSSISSATDAQGRVLGTTELLSSVSVELKDPANAIESNIREVQQSVNSAAEDVTAFVEDTTEDLRDSLSTLHEHAQTVLSPEGTIIAGTESDADFISEKATSISASIASAASEAGERYSEATNRLMEEL